MGKDKKKAPHRKQCKACPWRKDVVPERDIPNGYCKTRHENLKNTIARPGEIVFGALRVMACHDSPVGREEPCVGWVMHQLGPGNNIGLRMRALDGRYNNYETVGEQHTTLEATLGLEDDEEEIDWGDEEDE